jgi:acetyl esterase/lipase
MLLSRSYRRFALLGTLLGATLAAQAQPAEIVGKPIVYKQVAGQQLHLYISSPTDTAATHPAIVFIHGGGWTMGSPSQFNHQATWLAAHGMVAISIEYRLIAKPPSTESPQICVEDTKSAFRWVRAHAKELKIDPDKIVGSGGSAGGYLAVNAGLVPGWDDPTDDMSISAKPNALVLFFPVVDITGAKARFGIDEVKYAPGTYVSAQMPPTIIFGGLADKLVKPDTLRTFKAKADKAGGRCELLFYADQPHGFANKEPYNTITLIATVHFLKSLGYLPASTPDPDPPAGTPPPPAIVMP